MTKLLKCSLSEYFINISNLNIPSHVYKCPDSLEPKTFKIIDKYMEHRSIKLIKARNNCPFLTSQK